MRPEDCHETRPEDVVVAAFTHLRLISSRATDVMYNHTRTTLVESELSRLHADLEDGINFWETNWEMRKCECACLSLMDMLILTLFDWLRLRTPSTSPSSCSSSLMSGCA